MYILIIGYEVQQLLPVHQLSLFWSVMARVREVIVSFLSFLYCGDWGSKCLKYSGLVTKYVINKTNDLILNLTPENVTQHSRIVTTTCKGSSTPTKMSKIIGRQIH